MLIDGFQVTADVVAKFHNSVFVEGWFYHPADSLAEVVLLENGHAPQQVGDVGTPTGIELGPNLGFRLQALRKDATSPLDSVLVLTTAGGARLACALRDLVVDRDPSYATARLSSEFRELVRTLGERPLVLDIGGRPRSGKTYGAEYPEAEFMTVDIVDAPGVDVVADAHELSSVFDRGSVDAIFSVSTFEHLLMPWKVVLEMNKVLKLNGIAFVHTHQTLGLHDVPWDFFRFSDASWDALFNHRTGFEILGREMDSPQYVVPLILTSSKIEAERSAGFEGSAVLVKKVAETDLEWPVSLREVTSSRYVDG